MFDGGLASGLSSRLGWCSLLFMVESFFIALAQSFIQGLTEFLPISSAGHLIISRELLGLARQVLIMDVAAHAGTLLAALVYFRGTALDCLKGMLPKASPRDRHLLQLTFLASLPIVLFGAVLFLSGAVNAIRIIEVVAVANLCFACLLFIADRRIQTRTDFYQMTLPQAIGIGFMQAFALIPGASRAGVVITGARFLGYSREASARFALFLALPSISGALLLSATELESLQGFAFALLIALLSFIIALAVLKGFIRLSQKFSLVGFVVYRLALSVLLFMMIMSDYF